MGYLLVWVIRTRSGGPPLGSINLPAFIISGFIPCLSVPYSKPLRNMVFRPHALKRNLHGDTWSPRYTSPGSRGLSPLHSSSSPYGSNWKGTTSHTPHTRHFFPGPVDCVSSAIIRSWKVTKTCFGMGWIYKKRNSLSRRIDPKTWELVNEFSAEKIIFTISFLVDYFHL